jgi:hypothetical protein
MRLLLGLGIFGFCFLLSTSDSRSDDPQDANKVRILVGVRNQDPAKDPNYKITEKTVLTGGAVVSDVVVKQSRMADDKKRKPVFEVGTKFVKIEGTDADGNKVLFLADAPITDKVKLTGLTYKGTVVIGYDDTPVGSKQTGSTGGSFAILEGTRAGK